MPHYNLEGLENTWRLVRETPNSQVFRVQTARENLLTVDIHYTPPRVTTVSLCWVGTRGELTDGVRDEIFADLEKLVLRRGDYTVIDYTIMFSEEDPLEGNYSISKDQRSVMGWS